MFKALSASLGSALAVHSPALLPVLAVVVAAGAAYVIGRLAATRKVRHP